MRAAVLAGALAAAAPAGCAVLTVDVDVYKGPLANEQDVQLEQAAVLALGAKPLLVALRDRMENDFRHEDDLYVEEEPWYEPDFVPQLETEPDDFLEWPDLRFRTVPGARINAVLGLYEDLPLLAREGVASHLASEALRLLEAYDQAAAGFVEDHDRDEARWNALRLRPRDEQSDLKLYDAYLQLLHPNAVKRNSWRSAAFAALLPRWKVSAASTTERFALLEASRDRVEADARKLRFLGPEARQSRERFVDDVLELAASYRRLRETTDDIWTLGMRLLVDAGLRRVSGSEELNEELGRLIDDAAHLLAAATKLNEVKTAAQRGPGPARSLAESVEDQQLLSRQRFAEWLRADPAENATAMLELRGWSMRTGEQPYGFTRGPGDEELSTAAVRDGLAALVRGVGLGLESGRLPQGLDTLIDAYVNAKEDARAGARDRLLDALVRFAEKLRSIALLDVLHETSSADARGADEDYAAALETVSQTILTQVDDLRAWQAHDREAEKRAGEVAESLKRLAGTQSVALTAAQQRLAGDREDATAVLDLLIDNLQLERIRVLAAAQAATDPAAEAACSARLACLDEALAAAYAYRSDFVYVRPAGAYLRNSYPAPYLQPASRVTWSNLVAQHGRRALLGEGGGERRRDERERLAELDKRFWVNVNRIRLAGAGDTTYAVVKDDIGNWYVKGYETDVEDIMNSFSGLMTYSLQGAARAAQLVESGKVLKDEEGEEKPAPAAGVTSKSLVLDHLSDAAAEEFASAVRSASTRLGTAAAAAPERAAAAWRANDATQAHATVLALAFTAPAATAPLPALAGEGAALGDSLRARIAAARARSAAAAAQLDASRLGALRTAALEAKRAEVGTAADAWAAALTERRPLWEVYRDRFARARTIAQGLQPAVAVEQAPEFAEDRASPRSAAAVRAALLGADAEETLQALRDQHEALASFVSAGREHLGEVGRAVESAAPGNEAWAALQAEIEADDHVARLLALRAAIERLASHQAEHAALEALKVPGADLLAQARTLLETELAGAPRQAAAQLRAALETYRDRLLYASRVAAAPDPPPEEEPDGE